MIKLYRSGRFETLGDVSPFVYKLETWLRMAGIPYESEILPVPQLLEDAPRNLIPYIDLDDERLGDSSLIINALKHKYDDPLDDSRLNEDQIALGTLVKTLCEHELFYIMIYGRWLDGDYPPFARFIGRFFPEDQQQMMVDASLDSVKGMLHGYRMGRFEPDYVRDALHAKLTALAHFLGDQPFLFGEGPTTYDAGLYGILASTIHFPLPNPHVEIARSYETLVAYCDRVKTTYYDADDWVHGS